MSDTLDTGSTKTLLVDGRNPFADEVITVSDQNVLGVVTNSDGSVSITGLADGTATITVAPGSEDVNKTAGSDDVTVATAVPPTPLAVTLA